MHKTPKAESIMTKNNLKKSQLSNTKAKAYPNLPFVYVYDSSFTQFFKLEGIVLWPFVFISKPKAEVSPRILKHELTHVDQVRREGPLRFYTKYVYYIWASRNEYGNFSNAFFYNEYEDEAYENEKNPLTEEEIRETGFKKRSFERKEKKRSFDRKETPRKKRNKK
jgi:hypothetical protein